MRTVLFIVVVLLLCAIASADGLYQVSRVIDGDTVELLDGRRVRLQGVDAPELRQEYGSQAKRTLEILILDRTVSLVDEKPSAFGRVQGRLQWRDIDVGEAMLDRGYAWTDTRYVSGTLRQRYQAKQDQARLRRNGLWSAASYVAPWEWRRVRGDSTAPVQSMPVATQQPVIVSQPPVFYSPPVTTTRQLRRVYQQPQATVTWQWNGSAFVPTRQSYCVGPNCPR